MNDRWEERAGEKETNSESEEDEEIISLGTRFAPEGQIVLRL